MLANRLEFSQDFAKRIGGSELRRRLGGHPAIAALDSKIYQTKGRMAF
jgi:hypothetical protein